MNMRCAVSLVFLSFGLSFALPSLAQRGAAPHAGMAAPSARGGFAPSAHAGFSPPAGRGGAVPASRYAGPAGPAAGRANAQGSLFLPPGITSTRPVYYSNGVRRYGETGGRGQRNGGYAGVGYGLAGYGLGYDPGYLDFGYAGDLGNDAFDPLDPNNGPGTYVGTSAQDAFNPAASEDGSGPAPNGGGTYGPAEPMPSASNGALPQPPAPAPRPKPVPLPEEDAVTIVFKDGRPPEQIHNYALTRTTLYITGARVRAVPVEEIDLPATEKANQKAGVDFQLPTK